MAQWPQKTSKNDKKNTKNLPTHEIEILSSPINTSQPPNYHISPRDHVFFKGMTVEKAEIPLIYAKSEG